MPTRDPHGPRLPYANLSRTSGVRSYQLTPTGIILEFHHSPARYLYTNQSAGPEHITRMTALAKAGRDLSTYVSRHVQHRYARKLPLLPWRNSPPAALS